MVIGIPIEVAATTRTKMKVRKEMHSDQEESKTFLFTLNLIFQMRFLLKADMIFFSPPRLIEQRTFKGMSKNFFNEIYTLVLNLHEVDLCLLQIMPATSLMEEDELTKFKLINDLIGEQLGHVARKTITECVDENWGRVCFDGFFDYTPWIMDGISIDSVVTLRKILQDGCKSIILRRNQIFTSIAALNENTLGSPGEKILEASDRVAVCRRLLTFDELQLHSLRMALPVQMGYYLYQVKRLISTCDNCINTAVLMEEFWQLIKDLDQGKNYLELFKSEVSINFLLEIFPKFPMVLLEIILSYDMVHEDQTVVDKLGNL